MSGHTKLPWQFGIRDDGSIWFAAGDMRPGGGSHWQGDFPGTEADARLVTAGPDLLAAAKAAIAPLNAYRGYGWGDRGGVIGALQAAIAKAEGAK